ncbi:MAG: M23 family metallopeptidase [Gammaproteobacteria bacterium]|nr:M23 family metallopeptidase [Gammaproteobacteria bacterium]MDE0367774.1 M23 family metallopeptidase [Gammaproteobacteria bacterium]
MTTTQGRAWKFATAGLTTVSLVLLFSLRYVGLYSHQALAVVLVAGLLWVILGRGGLAWKGRLRSGLRRASWLNRNRAEIADTLGRAGFWTIATVACLWVFPRSTDLLPIMAAVGGIGVLRVAATFVAPPGSNRPVAFVMVVAATLLLFDLGRSFQRDEASMQIAPPFNGEWLVVQGGPSPLQNHHLSAYNQHFAVDLVRLVDGYIFDSSGETEGNAALYGWDQPLLSPADGRIAFTRDDMEDADGAGTVDESADAAGNQIVIELDNGLFVLLAHLQHGSVRVREGDPVRVGDELARIGNSGNTTLPHLHLQVQTHVDIWDPDNLSVPFAFDTDGRVPIRNDRIRGR